MPQTFPSKCTRYQNSTDCIDRCFMTEASRDTSLHHSLVQCTSYQNSTGCIDQCFMTEASRDTSLHHCLVQCTGRIDQCFMTEASRDTCCIVAWSSAPHVADSLLVKHCQFQCKRIEDLDGKNLDQLQLTVFNMNQTVANWLMRILNV